MDSLRTVLYRTALLMLKPDGLAAGKLGVVHGYLREHGFTIVAADHVTFTRFLWRELWRYQLTSATLDRLAVNDCVLTGRTALLLALSDERADERPASVRLSSLKGSATLSAQAPGSLRHLLGQPNRVLSFVHVADEPADVLRDLGLLLDQVARRRMLAAIAADAPDPEHLDTLDTALRADATGGRSLDPAAAVERVTEAVRRRRDADPTVATPAEQALAFLKQMRNGERIAWRAFAQTIDLVTPEVDRWDLAILGTTFITYDEPGWAKVVTNPEPDAWLRPVP